MQFSHTHCIRRSHFGWFCSISAFDGLSLAAFPLRILPRCPCPPRSRVRSHFCCFRSLSAFNGHILAGFAQSLHLTVAFWQRFLSAFSHTATAPSSRIPLCFGSFHSLSIRWRHLAAFADFQHSIVALWQLALPPCNLTHLCSLHSNTFVYW